MRNFTVKVFVILMVVAVTAVGQDFHLYPFTMYDGELLGGGARARGMAGAFVGLADDASAITWNPAGLVQIDRTHISGSASLLQMRAGTNITYSNPILNPLSAERKDDRLQFNYGSFVSPIRIKGHPFTAAASYQKLQSYTDEIYNRTSVEGFVSTTAGSGDIAATLYSTTSFDSDLDKYSLAFGTGLYGNLAVGLGVNIFNGEGEDLYSSAFLDTLPAFFGQTIIDSLVVRGVSTVGNLREISGFNFAGSLFYQADKFRIGLNVQTPYELITEHDVKRGDTIYVKSVSAVGDGPPISGRPTLYRAKTKVEQPLTIGVGASYQVTERFLIAGDFEFRASSDVTYFVRSEQTPLSSTDSINLFTLPTSIYYTDTSEVSYYTSAGELIEIFNEFELGYESSNQVRLGAEYLLPTRVGTIPLRGGFRYTGLPYRDVDKVLRDELGQVVEGFEPGSKVSRTTFTFGSGIHWQRIWLDFSVEINREEQKESGFHIIDFNVYEYTDKRTRNQPAFTLNFTGFF